MATAFSSISAPMPASPAAVHDNNVPCWTNDRRVRRLLASCAMLPPAGFDHRQTYGFATDRWFSYVGYRVEALTAIRDEIGGLALAHYHQHGDAGYESFRQWCRQPHVTSAIDAAILARGEG